MTKLVYGEYVVSCLLELGDEGCNASIVIKKEIWGIGERHPVFHLYNYIDPSKAHTPSCGCRVNPFHEPFLDFVEALRVAKEHEAEALASGKWIAT